MSELICTVCGKPILTGPVAWDPVTKTATPLDLPRLPRRQERPDLHSAHVKEGRQLMMGEPHTVLADGRRCHERCLP